MAFSLELDCVTKDRQIDPERLGFLGGAGAIILRVGINHPKGDALTGKTVAQGLDPRSGFLHDGTTVGCGNQNDRFAFGLAMEKMRTTFVIQKMEILDFCRAGFLAVARLTELVRQLGAILGSEQPAR